MRGLSHSTPQVLWTIGWTIGAAVTAAGCGVGDVVTPFTARDSAGVQIVESRLCSWDEQPWTIALSPEVRAGGGGPSSDTQLLGISDAGRLTDGRIAAADRELGRLRIFSRSGDHLQSMGTAGDGAGEFRSLDRLVEWRGRLWVFDVRRLRLTSFDATGTPAEEVELGPFESAQPIGDVLTIGDALFGIEARVRRDDSVPSLYRDTVHVFGLEPESTQPIVSFPGTLMQHVGTARAGVVGSRPYAPQPSWATDGSSLYFSSGDRFEFSVADGSGRTTRIVRRTDPPPPLTEAEITEWRDPQLDGVPESERAIVEENLARWVMPETLPTYVGLLVDASGNVWAQRWGEGAQEWEVYRSDGACLGSVLMPTGLRLLEVGEDHVLGAFAEHADREYVQLHRLLR